MSRFEIRDTPLRPVKVLQRRALGDARGFLERMFCEADLRELIPGKHIAQINRTLTRERGVVRGMHFQRPPDAETKFVSCLRGEVFDVAIDLRQGSPTFLRWHGEKLSGDNGRTLWIPEGFAHGFQTLSENCEMLYLHTAAYARVSEGGVSPLEPLVGIEWPLPITFLSERDASHPRLTAIGSGIQL